MKRSFAVKKKYILASIIAIASIFLFTACVAADGVDLTLLADDANQLPNGATCRAQLRESSVTGYIDAFSIILDSERKLAGAVFRYTDSELGTIPITLSYDEARRGYTKFTNLQELYRCLDGYKDRLIPIAKEEVTGGTTYDATDLTSPQFASTSVSSMPSVDSSNSQSYRYDYWLEVNNETINYGGDRTNAVRAAEESFDGAVVYEAITQSDGQILSKSEIASYPPVERPKGPDGTPLTIKATDPYYTNVNTGYSFPTLAEAITEARTRAEAADIHRFVRGADYGLDTQVPQFNEHALSANSNNVPLSPTDVYLQVEVNSNGGTSVTNFTQDNATAAERYACSKPEGGNIYQMQRGIRFSPEPVQSYPYWQPDQNLMNAVGATLSDLCKIYWGFMSSNGPQFYPSKEEALTAAENYGQGGSYPGGVVQPFRRGMAINSPDFPAVNVPSWTCPPGLNCSPSEPYYERNGQYYQTKRDAILSDPLGWLSSSQQITEVSRYPDASSENVTKNSLLRWCFYGLLCTLLPLLLLWLLAYLAARNRRKKPVAKPKVSEKLEPRTEEDDLVPANILDPDKDMLVMLKNVIVTAFVGVTSGGVVLLAFYVTAPAVGDIGLASGIGAALLAVILYLTLYLRLVRIGLTKTKKK